MEQLTVRQMSAGDAYFVATCTHENESAEVDSAARTRLAWIDEKRPEGLQVLVAAVGAKRVGFLYLVPIQICPWGPWGQDLLVIPCLFVLPEFQGKGAGGALLQRAEVLARDGGWKGLAVTAYQHDFWFMQASFFEYFGFTVAAQRGRATLMWKRWDPSAQPPSMLEPNYQFEPTPGLVVIDLFWNLFCPTSAIEAQRVREVAAEFGDQVIINEFPAEDRVVLRRCQIPRAIYVNGQETSWGYEAPQEGIRQAIKQALADIGLASKSIFQ